MLSFLAILLLSYLVGSIPASIIAARLLKGIDIRQYGSGNAGGTNTFRVLGVGPGLAVTLFDILKAVFCVLVVTRFDGLGDPTAVVSMPTLRVLAGVAAILGHVYTVFAGFKGGKGVATGAGVIFALAPIAGLVGLVVFAATAFATRYVSLSSMLAALSLPVTLLVRKYAFGADVAPATLWFAVLVAVFIVYTHRANIGRLRAGTESKIGRKKAPPAEAAPQEG